MKHDNKTIDPEGFLLVNDTWRSLNFTGKARWLDGTKAWYKDGKVHREDGPAVECHGYNEWYYDGEEGLENFPHEAKKNLARRFLHGA